MPTITTLPGTPGGSFEPPEPGIYMAEITEIELTTPRADAELPPGEQRPMLSVHLELKEDEKRAPVEYEGTVRANVMIATTPKERKKYGFAVSNFLISAGHPEDEIRAAYEKEESITFDTDALVGATCYVQVSHRQFTDRDTKETRTTADVEFLPPNWRNL